MERVNPSSDDKGESQVEDPQGREYRGGYGGGATRSSDETSVMEVEQRGSPIELDE